MAMLGAIEEVVVVVVAAAAAATAVLEDQEKGPSCVDQQCGNSDIVPFLRILTNVERLSSFLKPPLSVCFL
ncbi:hypothetical protein VNO77_25986 [Canavalia gladiata]|uniref:Secreted protein n=1 Tax=Canavalia gladiata TaxID=3824 RepID=A0AAN9KW98_CANGL